MNIKKIIISIGFVLAVYAVIPGFENGSRYFYKKFATLNPDWTEYNRDPEAWKEKERIRVNEAIKRIQDLEKRNEPIDSRTLNAGYPKKVPPEKYQYPPDAYPLAGGVLFSFLYFFVIFFGIRWITQIAFRVIKKSGAEEKRD